MQHTRVRTIIFHSLLWYCLVSLKLPQVLINRFIFLPSLDPYFLVAYIISSLSFSLFFSAESEVPGLALLGRLSAESQTDGVPLIWAIVQAADISFFSFNAIDLPKDVFMG